MRCHTLICTALVLAGAASAASAQTAANPVSSATRQSWDGVRKNVKEAAELMPEANYAFKPTPEVRSFGELVGHVANANYMICSMALGEKSPATADFEKTVKAKAELEKALAGAIAYCDSALSKLTATSALEEVKFFTGQTPRLGVFSFNNAHNMEHYGNMVTYMRMKKLVPPSSQR